MMQDITDQFRNTMLAADINPPDSIIADGKIHRFSTNGKVRDNAGWYILFGDNIPAGRFADYRRGIDQTWHAEIGRNLSPLEEAQYQAKIEAIRREREAEEKERHAQGCIRADKVLKKSTKAISNHPYLVRKCVKAYGIGIYRGMLVIPMRNNGKLHSIQFIAPNGEKRFLTGGRISECYFSIGKPEQILCICEGYATGATIYEATGYAVAIAFNAENLRHVAQFLRNKFPELKLIICADDDIATKGNPGLTKAKEAALAVDGLLVIPNFGDNRPQGMTDFNDLACYQSLDAVKNGIEKAIRSTLEQEEIPIIEITKQPAINEADWPDPLPLIKSIGELYHYPIEALPERIKNAVQEVIDYSQCPISLAACSALSVLSLAAQGLVDVNRRNGELISPVSLYFLVIADSGERKTSSDKHFTNPIIEWEKAERALMKPLLDEYFAAEKSWMAEIKGVEAEIKRLARIGEPTDEKKETLAKLMRNKPKKPLTSRLLHTDATPEALAFNLSQAWPSAGLLSNEAGIILGGHAMKADSVMKNLALLNTLWDGGTIHVDRRNSESFTLHGARLTMGLAVQSGTLRLFFNQLKGLAKDIGFISRLLITYPKSTIGTRFIDNSQFDFYHLPIFNQRINDLLNIRPTLSEAGGLIVNILRPSDEANEAWISFYNTVEHEMSHGGDMEEIRDSASKAAENVARLAALFHLFKDGVTGLISKEHMENAAKIITYHLYEKKRFDNEIALPESLVNASILDCWLIKRAKENKSSIIPANDVLNSGPAALRTKQQRDSVLEILADSHRIKTIKKGRQTLIEINPKLMENNDEVM